MPPMGRATKPTANVPNADSVPTIGSTVGKNSRLNTSAAAVPQRKKSYHSMAVPMKLAIMTGRIARRSLTRVLNAGSAQRFSPEVRYFAPNRCESSNTTETFAPAAGATAIGFPPLPYVAHGVPVGGGPALPS
jgi:hypothetical protein